MDVKWLRFLSATSTLFVMFLLQCVLDITTAHIERLFNKTILATDHRCRPQLNQSEATRVNFSLVHFSLMDLNEVQQILSSNVLLILAWVDETKKWDPKEYGGITKVHPEPTDIWRPRLFLSNTVEEMDMFEDDYSPLTIFNDGLTIWRPGGMIYTFCPMKMTNYPFDTQTCSLNITTGETIEMIWLESALPYSRFNRVDKSGEWLIKNSTTRTEIVNNKSYVKFILQLERHPSFTILNIVIPVTIISSLSSVTFLIPVDSGERVSFSITVLLSLTVYTGEISKNLPTNSESLPLLIIYLDCVLLHSGLVIIANLAVLKRYLRNYKTGHQMWDITSDKFSFRKKLSDSSLKDKVKREQETSLAYKENKPSKKSQFLRKHNFYNFNNATQSRRYRHDKISKKKRASSSFERPIKRYADDEDDTETVGDSNWRQCFSSLSMSCVLNYISLLDFVLFLVSFVLWLLITVVFMTFIAYGFF